MEAQEVGSRARRLEEGSSVSEYSLSLAGSLGSSGKSCFWARTSGIGDLLEGVWRGWGSSTMPAEDLAVTVLSACGQPLAGLELDPAPPVGVSIYEIPYL